jgi:hypothetical protein
VETYGNKTLQVHRVQLEAASQKDIMNNVLKFTLLTITSCHHEYKPYADKNAGAAAVLVVVVVLSAPSYPSGHKYSRHSFNKASPTYKRRSRLCPHQIF